MNKVLAGANNTLWLAEPGQFEQCIARVESYGDHCLTREQILKAHRADLERARQLHAEAVSSARAGVVEQLAADAAPKAIRSVKGKVGIIPIVGPLQQHMTSELEKAGGTSLDFVSYAFGRMMDDPNIGAIVLQVDSPGGSSAGLQELSDKIFAARGQKPTYAIADSMAASAAFWLLTSADMAIVTPSGAVGSVGVYLVHVDETAALEKLGVKVTLVSAGKFKTEMMPTMPLSEEAKTNMQARADEMYAKFLGALKRNRGTSTEDVRANYGQGRVVYADAALAAGMVDRVLSFEDLMGRLTAGSAAGVVAANPAISGGLAASAELLRLRHDQRKRLEASR